MASVIRDGKEIQLTANEVYLIFEQRRLDCIKEDILSRYNVPEENLSEVADRVEDVLDRSDSYWDAYWASLGYACEGLGYEEIED